MKYVHPDIVVGDPVPVVEPRMNGDQFELAHSLVRWGRVGVGLVVVLIVVLGVIDATLKMRVAMMGVMLVGGIGVMFQPKHFRLMRLWRSGLDKGGRGGQRMESWGLPIRLQIELMCYQFLLTISAQGIASADGGLGGLSSFLAMAGVLIGSWLIVYGFRAREPGQICCVDCEYPLAGLTIPCECPECGRMIYDASWTTDRARVRSGWLFGVGGVLVPLGLVSMYVGIFQPSVLYAPVPRGALMQIASRDRSAFEQLVSRSLSEVETKELIDRLIEENSGPDGWDYTTSAQGRWLSQFVGTGMLDGGRLDRIMHRLVEPARIEGPIVGWVGEEMVFRIRSDEVELPSYSMTPRLYFRGFQVDDGSSGGRSALESGHRVAMRLNPMYGDGRSVKGSLRWAWEPEQAGAYVVRGRVVLALLPKAARLSLIDWGADERTGEAEISFEGDVQPIWWEIVDLEWAVIVEPER